MKNYWIDRRCSYPQDDEYSIQQGDPGPQCCDLGLFYGSIIVQNEVVLRQHLEYTPILAGSLIGTIYVNDKVTQTFYVDSTGNFQFKIVEDINAKAIGGKLTLNTGELSVYFDAPCEYKLVVSYEYER